jgi:hypothetical protein
MSVVYGHTTVYLQCMLGARRYSDRRYSDHDSVYSPVSSPNVVSPNVSSRTMK